MEEEARYRRKLRVEKIRALRNKLPHIQINENVCIPSVSTNINKISDVVKDRKVRNRESALLSRKRKSDEMMNLQNRVHSLEDEVRMLRERLKLYEHKDVSSYGKSINMFSNTILQPSFMNDGKIMRYHMNNCNSSQEPAAFKLF